MLDMPSQVTHCDLSMCKLKPWFVSWGKRISLEPVLQIPILGAVWVAFTPPNSHTTSTGRLWDSTSALLHGGCTRARTHDTRVYNHGHPNDAKRKPSDEETVHETKMASIQWKSIGMTNMASVELNLFLMTYQLLCSGFYSSFH
ncbi:hypothetical protein TNCV_849141 [Trichonephila clavipes]|uniref:Uncharacterized protein n=1 Tax=Trichonephila clavipes TaxID=2585209 RepID=A0A8X6V6W0_TRICX|nr:hypothetical protein TNCV_849141 [Trichonephila clavipes]